MVKIANYYRGGIPINPEKTTRKLLRAIPQKYLFGLDSIIILNRVAHKKFKEVCGKYIPKSRKELPRIEIAVDLIYKDVPRFIFYLPFISKFMFASVLFHEIGHHYHSEHIRIKKEKWESYADNFSNVMLSRTFPGWRFALKPFLPIIKFLRRNRG